MKGDNARPVEAVHQLFDTVCLCLRQGMFAEAIDALERLLERDVEFPRRCIGDEMRGFLAGANGNGPAVA